MNNQQKLERRIENRCPRRKKGDNRQRLKRWIEDVCPQSLPKDLFTAQTSWWDSSSISSWGEEEAYIEILQKLAEVDETELRTWLHRQLQLTAQPLRDALREPYSEVAEVYKGKRFAYIISLDILGR
jgi:hypothetical protein